MPFKKGVSGNPDGRQKGVPNKVTRTFKEMLTEALLAMQDDKKHNLIQWGKENPTEFYKIASKLIPTELSGAIETKLINVIPPDDNK
jgi:hypothetical protein